MPSCDQLCAHLYRDEQLLLQLDIPRAPHYSTLNRAMDRVSPSILQRMVRLIASTQPPPRKVAVDSTGMSHTTGGEWFSVKWRDARRRRFHALHNAVDTDTLLIHATRVRGRPGGDPRFMVPLVRRVSKSILETVYGNKAYISRRNAQFIADVGAYPAIEPKSSSSINSRSHWACGRMVREYRADPEEWRRVRRYGKRSLAETVFSMMKLRHGGSLSSRGGMERRRELLIKVVLHNIERLNFLECAGR